MIPLVCLDVDGTLVGASGVVSDAVWTAAHAAVRRGQRLALCTARGAFGASLDMARRLDPEGWHVFHAGGAVVHAATGATRSTPLDDETVSAAGTIAADAGWTIEFYSPADYTVDSESTLAVEHAALLGVPFRRRPIDDLDAPGGVVRIQFVVRVEEVGAVRDSTSHLGLHLTSATSPIMPGAAFVSLTAPGVTKATGITMIADELGLSMREVMMVGDGHNDQPAIDAVGVAVAMGNAIPEVKQAASIVVGDVAVDGAAEALDLSGSLDP